MQRSFDDLGTPLHDVTFVVLDFETTGGSAATCSITEVGAVKLRGGECLGTFQTLVNPGMAIPPSIVYLTGITEAMVAPAPRIESVLPAFLEFIGEDAVIVGHNVRFDLSFLRAAMHAGGYPALRNRWVDTCGLARRLVREEVPNCKLGTLASHFRLATRPTHRALDDAMATGELLHYLLERAGSIGVTALDDLLMLPKIDSHPQLHKLRLTTSLPRAPGVYLFRDRGGRVLYVGKAVDIRRRVRSYFSSEERRKVGQLLREATAIDHIVTNGELEASVLEVRLIHELLPRFNRQSKRWRRYAYVKLTLDERFPRLSVVRAAKAGDGCIYIGPLTSSSAAHLVVEAIESAAPLRRCKTRIGRSAARPGECAPAQLGVATCPCAGTVTEEQYAHIVERVVRGLTLDPSLLLGPLESRMRGLADAERYEEAAAVRDRAAALARALWRQRRLDAVRRAGRITLEVPGHGTSIVEGGRLVIDGALPFDDVAAECDPLPSQLADEVACIAGWLEARAGRYRLLDCDGGLAWPLPRLPRFEAVG
jgi:DNA polymerase-3 subunit epsilon